MAEPSPARILAFGPGTWRYPDVFGSPRYHLWTLAEMGWEVLYIEPPIKWRWRPELWEAPDRPFRVLSPARVVPFGVRLARASWQGNLCRRVTARQLAARAIAAARQQQSNPDILWFGAPWHSAVLEAVRAQTGKQIPPVYHVYDELAESPAFSPLQRRLLAQWEQQLLQQVDTTFCSSMPQLECRKGRTRRAVLLENAIPESFLPEHRTQPDTEVQAIAQRLESLERPRYVYGGVADHRLDPEIFCALLDGITAGSVIFLGKVDANLDSEFRKKLQSHPRAHLTGPIPHRAYPHLYEKADVLLLGHRRTPFTDAMYPEKINEYLACGRPVVAVDMPEVQRLAAEPGMKNVLRPAKNPEDFLRSCLAAAEVPSSELGDAGRSVASRQTWKAKARTLASELNRLITSQ